MKSIFCHVCLREVKVTKDGRYKRHGHRVSFASRDWFGVPIQSGYSGRITKRSCVTSGEKVPNFLNDTTT